MYVQKSRVSPAHAYPFGSIPRCFSSLRTIRLSQAAKDSSPSCCWAFSINSLSSGSSRNWNGGLPRLSFLCVDTSITPVVVCLCVMTHYIQTTKKTTPRSAGTLPRRLTKTLNGVTLWLPLIVPHPRALKVACFSSLPYPAQICTPDRTGSKSLPPANAKRVLCWWAATCFLSLAVYQYQGRIMDKLLTMPIPVSADLFQLADICAAFAVELMECADTAKYLALCGRLSHALTALRLRCNTGLPPHLLEVLRVDDIPAPCVPDCWSDSDLMLGYAQALTQALLSCSLAFSVTVELTGLLHDLVLIMVEHLKQPHIKREAESE